MTKLQQPMTSSLTRRLVPAALALASLAPMMNPQGFGQACTTTITGKVFSPNGTDPLPNILVYVPTTPVQALPTGVSDCTAASQLVSGTPLVSTTTAADGTFSLTSPGLAGTQTIVIQAGKWRRQYTGVSVKACQTTSPLTLAMPQNQSQGDIPHIAISSGSSDAIECVIRKIGISDSEFTAPTGTGRIGLYAGSQSPGITKDASGLVLPVETTLVSNQAALNAYDLAIFACQGTPTNPAAAVVTNQNNVVSFGDAGGRVFATHYSYVWLDNSTVWAGTANWSLKLPDETISSSTTVPIDATIDQTYPEGVVLANWLFDIGATPTKGQLPLYVTKKDQTGVNPPTQSWATLNSPADGNPVMQFTFDTPINANTTPSISLSFVNSPNTYDPLAGQTTGSVAISVVNNSSAAADSSLNLSITLPTGFTATSLAGANVGSGWVCSVATLTCNRTATLAAGASDGLTLGLIVSTNAQLGQQQVSVSVAGGGLSGTNQCGRVLFNEYHVETISGNSKSFPAECTTTTMTPQEKFLEFSLYNLSNFVAPVTSDTIDVVEIPTTTWATPAPIYYGTPLSATQLDATSNAPGTFAYTPPAGTILPVGVNEPLSAVFTPTDTTSYTTANVSTTITVLQDTTQTMMTSASPNPGTLGSPIVLTATVVGNAAAPTGTVTFYNNGVSIGTGTLTASTGDASVATLTTSTLPLGSNPISATYIATTNFAGSSSATSLPVVVRGTSTVTITGLVSPIEYGQIIGDTAQILVSGSSTGGTTTVYINGVVVCTLPVAPGLTTSCPATTGANYPVGTYTIYAVFSGDALYMGSTSPMYTVQIIPDPTVTTVTSSLNPSYFGNSVTFTATVSAQYATPTGSVTFSDGSTMLGVGTLNTAGTATYSTTALAIGTHNITVNYAATTDFSASATVTALAQVVLPPLPLNGAPGYILTVTPTTLNAPVGAATPITVTVQEVNGYSEPIALTCAGLTNEATCTFTPAIIAAGGGTATLYITPAAPHNCGSNVPDFVASNHIGGIAEGGLGLAAVLMLLGLTSRRRRKLLKAAMLVLALCAMPMLNGCGTVGCTDLGTKPGTYSFTVQAAPTAGPSGQYEGTQLQTVTYTATL